MCYLNDVLFVVLLNGLLKDFCRPQLKEESWAVWIISNFVHPTDIFKRLCSSMTIGRLSSLDQPRNLLILYFLNGTEHFHESFNKWTLCTFLLRLNSYNNAISGPESGNLRLS